MVKLNERKIRWIIQQKLRGKGAGEIALIQRASHRRVEQIWQAYKQTGIPPTLKTPGKPKGAPVRLHEAALVLKVHDKLKVNALTLERVLRDAYGIRLPHNKIRALSMFEFAIPHSLEEISDILHRELPGVDGR